MKVRVDSLGAYVSVQISGLPRIYLNALIPTFAMYKGYFSSMLKQLNKRSKSELEEDSSIRT